MSPTAGLDAFRAEYLSELGIAERQILALAEAFPEDKYGWYPAADARSVSEVFVHLAAGHFSLLEVAGVPAPVDLYGPPGPDPHERFLQIVRRNDEMEKSITDKAEIAALLRRSFDEVRNGFTAASLDDAVVLFGEQSTVRRLYMRLLAHAHEHMGQMIACLRMNEVKAPWPDWRPDRR